jgi:hypothetical protein
MDAGIETIRRLSERRRTADPQEEAVLAEQALTDDRERVARLETAIPARLAELAAASDGDLVFEDSLYRSTGSAAFQVRWKPGTLEGHSVEIWLHRESGTVEWRWAMGNRQPPIVQRVSAARFDLGRLDDLVAGLGDPRRWRAGFPPDV